MKVALTTGSLSRDAGGLFESVRALGKELAAMGEDVSVYGLWDKNWTRDVVDWAPLNAQAFGYRGPRFVAFSPEMDRALDETRPDVLNLQGLWQYPSVATRRQYRLHAAPYIVSPRGMLDSWALANARWKKQLAAWIFENAVLRDAACFHALCTSEADAIRAYGLRERIEVVPNGVKLPEELTTIEQVKVGPKGARVGASESKNTEGRKWLLFLGRIHPKKGLVAFIRAWAEIQNPKSKTHHSKDWQLVIAGWDQGGHEAELKALCAELGLRIADCGSAENLKLNSYKLKTLSPEIEAADVVFYGPAFGEEKEALLRRAEAFVLPSFSEGLPMSVLEAWAHRLPVVMTPECNLPEGFVSGAALQIRSGEGSFQGSDFSFQHGLRTLLEMSDPERAAMGMRGRRLVEEKFTWPKVAAQMKKIYESLL